MRGTGTWALNTWVNEVQAGSYALMDSAYAKIGDLPFGVALTMLASVISINPAGGWAVADSGLKAQGMDHGNPDADFGGRLRPGLVPVRRAPDLRAGRARER